MTIQELVSRQHAYFYSDATRSVEFRKTALRTLQTAISKNQGKIAEALKADFNKPEFESYMTETGLVLHDLHFAFEASG